MAQLYQFHNGDFERSVAEARIAAEMVPNDPFSRADNAEMLARAGAADEAIVWLEDALRHDPKPLDLYFANLALAYYLAGRPEDAIAVFTEHKIPWATPILAAAEVRSGKLADAQARMAAYRQGEQLVLAEMGGDHAGRQQPSMVPKCISSRILKTSARPARQRVECGSSSCRSSRPRPNTAQASAARPSRSSNRSIPDDMPAARNLLTTAAFT